MGSVTRAASLIAAAALALLPGCGWFKPAAPEHFENQKTVIANFSSPDNTLNTLDLALEDKGSTNGLSVYTSAFADTASDAKAFHAFFDPQTLNRMAGLGVLIPTDWDLQHESAFYSKLVTVIIPLSSHVDFFWKEDFTQGEDERRPEYAILHREYSLLATQSDSTRTLVRGLATIRIERMSPTRWAVVTWDDRELGDAHRDLGEISMGERRLEP